MFIKFQLTSVTMTIGVLVPTWGVVYTSSWIAFEYSEITSCEWPKWIIPWTVHSFLGNSSDPGILRDNSSVGSVNGFLKTINILMWYLQKSFWAISSKNIFSMKIEKIIKNKNFSSSSNNGNLCRINSDNKNTDNTEQ